MLELALSITTLLANSLLGFFVYFQNKKSWTNRFFILLTLLINIYLVVNYVSLHPPGGQGESQFFWIRVVMFVTSFIGPTLFLLAHTFPYDKVTLSKKKIAAIITLCAVSASMAFTPLIFTHIEYPGGQPNPVPGPGIIIFMMDYVGMFFLSFLLLLYKYRKSEGKEKRQIFFFLLGVAGTFSAMGVFSSVLVIMFNYSGLVFMGPNSTLILIGLLAYAIVKHRFLDTRLLLVRSLVYFLIIFLIGIFYSAGIILIEGALLGEPLSYDNLFISLCFTLLITFSFQYLQAKITKATEHIFYRHAYSQQALLEHLTHIMASTLFLADLTEKVLQELVNQVKISTASVALIKDDQISFFKKIGNQHSPYEQDTKLIELINYAYQHSEEKILIFEEMSESPIKETMRAYGYSVIAPLEVKQELLGGLLLREKDTGETYSTQDISILKILIPELAVAIQNAYSYEEIRKFNVTLEQEVLNATKQLREANEKLKELDKLKDEFVSIASHELRTPMGAIKSMVSMILEGDYGKVAPEIQEPLQDIDLSVERLINLVNSMLNISRIEAGRMKFTLKEFLADDLIKKIIARLEPLAHSRKIELIIENMDSVLLQGDQEKIEQVLNNLIGNSLKFTEDGGRITLRSKVSGELIQVFVSDSGTGIDPIDQKKLFGKFEQVAQDRIGKPVGTGLGLYISRELARKMGGELWIEHSELGKGSTFGFSIPLAHSQVAQRAAMVIKKEAELHPDQK